MSWYVIHTKPRQEFRANHHLQHQGYQTYLPVCQVQTVRKGKLLEQPQALFKRYLFIQLDAVQSNWMPIRSTRGVHHLLVSPVSKLPVVVREELIVALQERFASTPCQTLFQSGQLLDVKEGLFKGLQGIFQKLQTTADGEVRAHLFIELLGQQQHLSLPLDQVRPHSSVS